MRAPARHNAGIVLRGQHRAYRAAAQRFTVVRISGNAIRIYAWAVSRRGAVRRPYLIKNQ